MMELISNSIKAVMAVICGMGLYIVNDFKSDINGNLFVLNTTVSTMSTNLNELNTTMATVVANDKAKNIQLESHTKRFDRLEKEYSNRIDRLENFYFKKKDL